MTKKRKHLTNENMPRSNSPPAREREVYMLRVTQNELQHLSNLLCPSISVNKDIPEKAENYVHEIIIRYQSDMCDLRDKVKKACDMGLHEELQAVNAVLSAWFWDSLVVPVYDARWTKQKWLTPPGEILGPRLVKVVETYESD
jgi:hypothetical protein